MNPEVRKLIELNKKATKAAKLFQEARKGLDELGLYEESMQVSRCLIEMVEPFKKTLKNAIAEIQAEKRRRIKTGGK